MVHFIYYWKKKVKFKLMKNIKNIFLLFFSFLIILLFLELVLRIAGNSPRIDNLGRNDDPTIYKNDNEIGWVHKTGKYEFKPWSNKGKITKFTIEKDGSRSDNIITNSEANVLFFGGSLTQGWAVDDEETFARYFQELNKDLKIFNYGVGGYGGYQSLLLLKRITKNFNSIDHIIYGFIDHHEVRNVAAGSWLYLLNKYSNRGHVSVPYGSIENKKLKLNSPIKYIKIPFSEYSALIAKVEKRIMKLKSIKREKNQFEISKLIIEEMSNIAEQSNSKFSVLMLDSSKESLLKYSLFLKEKKINFFYCSFPPNKFVEGDGHPNSAGHKIVASCLNENFIK